MELMPSNHLDVISLLTFGSNYTECVEQHIEHDDTVQGDRAHPHAYWCQNVDRRTMCKSLISYCVEGKKHVNQW